MDDFGVGSHKGEFGAQVDPGEIRSRKIRSVQILGRRVFARIGRLLLPVGFVYPFGESRQEFLQASMARLELCSGDGMSLTADWVVGPFVIVWIDKQPKMAKRSET